jgi:hypothetical protein
MAHFIGPQHWYYAHWILGLKFFSKHKKTLQTMITLSLEQFAALTSYVIYSTTAADR